MEFLNLFNADAREPAMVDSRGIRACLQEMKKRDLEFKVKVDKAQTVPYTVQIEELRADDLVLAFQRPLPPELAKGALFLANFQMEGLNFQFPIKFQGRTGYLRYQFSIPERILKLERRAFPRIPFRPRENSEANLRDDGVPGLGVSGPLLNVSREGVAIRVDRVLRLDNGLRLSVNGSHFPQGKYFGLIRIQGLPGLPQLDMKGFVVHATDKGGILLLGLSFQLMEGDAPKQLEESLKLRAKLLQVKSSTPAEPASPGTKKTAEPQPARVATIDVPASWDSNEVLNEAPPDDLATQDQDPLRLLLRRTLPLLITPAESEVAEPLTLWLKEHGYRRLCWEGSLPPPDDTLVLDTRPGFTPGQDALAVPPQDTWDRQLLPLLEQRAGERT